MFCRWEFSPSFHYSRDSLIFISLSARDDLSAVVVSSLKTVPKIAQTSEEESARCDNDSRSHENYMLTVVKSRVDGLHKEMHCRAHQTK